MKKKTVVTMPELQKMMGKNKFLSIEEAIRNGNDGQNQDIKRRFVGREVYCNVGALCEYILTQQGNDPPFDYNDIENYYSYREWSTSLQGEDLRFDGGSEDDKNTFLENFERLQDESQELFDSEKISEATHERNLELIAEAKESFEEATEETEPAEIFEWWAVSSFLYDKLKERGYCVVDAGSCYVWGRTCTGQAILLDGVITRICADMGILEGQENSWAKPITAK